jgi:hypothetical protein
MKFLRDTPQLHTYIANVIEGAAPDRMSEYTKSSLCRIVIDYAVGTCTTRKEVDSYIDGILCGMSLKIK